MYTLYIIIVICVCVFTPKIANISFNIGSSSFPQCLVSEKLHKEIM